MSSVVVNAPAPRRPVSLYSIAAAMSVVALAFTIGNVSSVWVTADGERVTLPAESTVADLVESGALTAEAGDLYAVDGTLLRDGGGEPPVYLRNGSRVDERELLFDGDSISALAGADVTESVVSQRIDIPAPTEVRGEGPITRTLRSGVTGLKVREVGALSGKVVSERVVRKPIATIVKKTKPAAHRKLVALTFDDGPWGPQTSKVLDILDKEGAKATFFVVGTRVRQYPGLVKRAHEEGHQIANHSASHQLLTRLGPGGVYREIMGGRSRVKAITGDATVWFRPPGGGMNTLAWNEARKQKLRVVMWTVDTNDWKRPAVSALVKRTVRDVKPGSIVLMHDGGGDRSHTVKSLGPIIRELKKRGYTFVTVEELMAADQ